MTDYDSDSTEADYTETNVLLGYASRDAQDDMVSKLGGGPDWLDADKAPSAALARCGACKGLMALLLQLNGELPERFPGHERRLYVFACRRGACRRRDGSVRVLRGVRAWADGDEARLAEAAEAAAAAAEQQEPSRATGHGVGDALFGATALGARASSSSSSSSPNANPFSAAAAPSPSPNNPLARPSAAQDLSRTFAQTLSLDAPPPPPPPPPEPEPPEAWPAPSSPSLPPPYPTLYLADADYETLDATPPRVPPSARLDAPDAAEPSLLDREAFESTMDAAFQKFADRLAHNPDQVIRYDFAGAPLLYSATDAVARAFAQRRLPPCPACRAPRVFEVQLTPNAIAELEADDMSLEGMEWGTIIVAVCERDCLPRHTAKGEAAYLEEWAGVQWEELTKPK